MKRIRYWKLTAEEMKRITYDTAKLLNWEIKAILDPDDARFVGLFWYKLGNPVDYESIQGIAFYHNNITKDMVDDLTKFLQSKFKGNVKTKDERIFLSNSDEITESTDIASLAEQVDEKFHTTSIITLEFEGMDAEEQQTTGLPESKLLPIS